jgi:hypothetical protein
MRNTLIVVFICGVVIGAISQSESPKYRPGTIMDVKAHDAGTGRNVPPRTYDVAVRVDNTIYVVLYTQRPGTISPEYRTGLELPVLVKRNTIKFNDRLGRSQELPILSRKSIPETKRQSVHPISARPVPGMIGDVARSW